VLVLTSLSGCSVTRIKADLHIYFSNQHIKQKSLKLIFFIHLLKGVEYNTQTMSGKMAANYPLMNSLIISAVKWLITKHSITYGYVNYFTCLHIM